MFSIKNVFSWKIYELQVFLISNTSISNARLKLAKNQANSNNALRLNFSYLKLIHILYQRYHPKVIGHLLKNKRKNKCDCIHKITRLIIMKMMLKMKNRWHRFDIYRSRSRNNHKYSKRKTSLTVMMLPCIKQHLSNIQSSIQKKIEQHWGLIEKSVACKKTFHITRFQVSLIQSKVLSAIMLGL